MANYKTALMTKAITSGIGDIVGAVTDVQKMGLLKKQQDMDLHRFNMESEKHKAAMEKWKHESRLIPLTDLFASVKEGVAAKGLEITPGMEKYLYNLSRKHVEKGVGFEGIRGYNLPEASKELESSEHGMNLTKIALRDFEKELKAMDAVEAAQGTEKEGVKKLTPKDLEANQQRRSAISKMQGLAQQELEADDNYRQQQEFQIKQAKEAEGRTQWQEYVSAESEKLGLSDEEFNAIANADPTLGMNMLQERRLGAEKEVKAPTTRTRISGDTEIQEEWDPTSGTWKAVGKGPRWKASEAGDKYTTPQRMDDARQDYSNRRRAILDKHKIGYNPMTGLADLARASDEAMADLAANDRAYDDKAEKLTGDRPLGTVKENNVAAVDDVPNRFKSDQSMKGNRLGKKTEQGYEVYKGNKLVGHYK